MLMQTPQREKFKKQHHPSQESGFNIGQKALVRILLTIKRVLRFSPFLTHHNTKLSYLHGQHLVQFIHI